jgi:arylsulfatase A-like enzyme/Flp pilus assembly protein TadD
MRRIGAVVLLGALGAALAGAGCRRGEETGPFPGAPVILLSIDTLRSDRLPAYGYQGVETPALDAFRRDAILFERAYSHTPLTLPSHVSLLTGRLPSRHGVRDNIGYVFDPAGEPYLPRLLKEGGYATGAAVSAYVLRRETGLAPGFDFFDDEVDWRPTEVLGNSQRSGRETVRRALDWLGQVGAEPFFLFVHLYEPHSPYAPPEPFASRYRASPYDGEVAAADAIVGDFLAELKRREIYDSAVVVVLSDHGEGLGDHGEEEHGVFLYREALQVPLLLKLPESRLGGTSVAAPAQLADVAPTLLALTGRPVPGGLDGTSLLDLRRPEAPVRDLYAETFYPRLHFGWSELTSLIRGRSHYIDAPRSELYDLEADPAERNDILRRERRTYAELREAIHKYESALAAPSQVDAETAGRLASLGYLGGTAVTGDGPLPDPKDRIHTVAGLGQAMQLFASQEFARAVPLLRQLVAENPKMVDAWETLGQSLQRLGQGEEALAAYRQAMEASGGTAHVAIATGGVLLDLERYGEAREHAQLALAANPAGARTLLAQIALAEKDFATAERESRAALEASRSGRIAARMVLARTLQEQGRLDEGLRVIQEAVDQVSQMEGDPKFTGLWFLRGDLLARLGRQAEAEQAFLREIADFPSSPLPYTRLAVLYASQGRPAEAVGMLRRMVERNDSPVAYAEAVRTLRILGDSGGAAALLQHARQRHPDSRELRAL